MNLFHSSLLWTLVCCCGWLFVIRRSSACTTLITGKAASVDGSVMATHSNDGGGKTDSRLVRVPARDYPEGSLRPIYGSPEDYPRYVGTDKHVPEYCPENCLAGEGHCDNFVPIGYIPQVSHTFAYMEATYGVINEMQVAIGESTCSSVFVALPVDFGGLALLSVDQLSYIAMERASSAREAIQIMGSLGEQYGFYGPSASFEGGAESLMVIDPEEAFVFHILADPTATSAIWVAQRVPDDHVAVVANMFTIRDVNLSDTFNFLGRQDMWDIAEAQGLWKPGMPMDFTATFSDGEYSHKYYSGRRMWGAWRLLAPSQKLNADYVNLKETKPYPFSLPVDYKITPLDLMKVHRDWYEGTRFSTSAGLAGGAFGSPDRYSGGEGEQIVDGNWERAIALYRSSDSYVVQARHGLPNEVGGIVWWGPHASHGTVFVPFMAGMTKIASCVSGAYQGVLDTKQSFWVHRMVENLAQMKFSYIINDIRALQSTLENESVALVDRLTSDYVAGKVSLDDVTESLIKNAEKARDQSLQLFYNTLFKYADGYLNEWVDGSFVSKSVGYPAWWLDKVGYSEGPPDTHIKDLNN